MTPNEIADHNQTIAELLAEDGIPRLTWEQHGAAFSGDPTDLAPGQQVAVWDSSTPGTVVARYDGGRYRVTFPDLPGHTPISYPAAQLRPWPAA